MFTWALRFSRNDSRQKTSMDSCLPSIPTMQSNLPGNFTSDAHGTMLDSRFDIVAVFWFSHLFLYPQSRSAFAPLYGNQFAGPQSSQYWSNSSAHYHGGNATGMQTIINKHGNSDVDGGLHNSNRKEKRQYKKRKHKNQREKLTTGKLMLLLIRPGPACRAHFAEHLSNVLYSN